MYLLIYPSPLTSRRMSAPIHAARAAAVSVDFVTPDGMVVPRILAEAALRARTAVMVGGLLVGVWPQS